LKARPLAGLFRSGSHFVTAPASEGWAFLQATKT
jgi:hypothetical protein